VNVFDRINNIWDPAGKRKNGKQPSYMQVDVWKIIGVLFLFK
jgi:hypothetical protein